MKISTQRAFDGHTLTHEISDNTVYTTLTDREGWFVTSHRSDFYSGDYAGRADAICLNNDAIYLDMGWDGE